MPNNRKVIKYVLGFENSDLLCFDFQYVLNSSAKNIYCSKDYFWEYNSLNEASEALNAMKNKAKNIANFCFYSDDWYSLDEKVEGKTDDDFYIEPPDHEEGFLGCKYLKLPFLIDDFKIFAREVEVTYKEVSSINEL